MDVLRINPNTWEPDAIIENYTSMIWTERYQPTGEFEMRTNDVNYCRNLIPEGSLIGVRDSSEVMFVETYEISEEVETDTERRHGEGAIIKGRTFESFMENRATVIVGTNPGKENMWLYEHDDIWPTDAAKALIMSHLTVANESTRQKVPGVAVENLISPHNGEQMSYDHARTNLYEEVLDLLRMENAGIRNQLNFAGELKIYIYKGKDRTIEDEGGSKEVIFRLDAEHLMEPHYLFTTRNYKNLAYVVSDEYQMRVWASGVDNELSITGLDRRILLVDPGRIKPESTAEKKRKQAKARGLAALRKHNDRVFFDTKVSPDVPYKRGVDWNLGDLVTVMANHGISQTMRITEHVRIEDQEGDRDFPTLVQPSPELV